MATGLVITALVSLGVIGSDAPSATGEAGVKVARPPQIEVCFVLDTTGSMGGLIEGAKARIWAIANQMIAARPTPRLKIALIGYRDRGDDYVTRIFDLSEDIDAVYANLQDFQAGGGGDAPESVNQAIHEAVTRIGWSEDRRVLKVVFLVGDCPPHMDYPNDVAYPESCRAAVRKDLIINTVQCGGQAETTPVWKEIADLAEGSYVAIGQTGDMQTVRTPADEELARLNVALGKTLVPYGDAAARRAVRLKQEASEAAAAPTAADRLAFNRATGRAVQGGGDLVSDLEAGRVALEELTERELPPELRSLSSEALEEGLARRLARRKELESRIDELVLQRRDFVAREMARLSREGKGDAFDVKVAEILREQASRKGIRFGG
jgi:Mg-chelatase subunit ChlD